MSASVFRISRVQVSSCSRDATARAKITGNRLFHFLTFPSSSPRPHNTSTFFSSRLFTISSKASHFLCLESRRNIFRSGRQMASGIPGKPPPLPKSQHSTPIGRLRKCRRERQGNTCLPQILWISLRDTRLIRRFSLSRISIQFSSFSHTSEAKEHPWVSRITRTSEALRIASSVSNKNIMPG